MSWTTWWKCFDGHTTTEIRMTNNQQRRQLFCATLPYTSHSTVANPESTQKDTDISRTWRVARHCPPRKSAPSPLSPSQPPLLSPFISAPKPLFLPLQVRPLSSLLSYLPPWPVALVCRPLSSLRRAAHNRRRGSCRIHTQHPPPPLLRCLMCLVCSRFLAAAMGYVNGLG